MASGMGIVEGAEREAAEEIRVVVGELDVMCGEK